MSNKPKSVQEYADHLKTMTPESIAELQQMARSGLVADARLYQALIEYERGFVRLTRRAVTLHKSLKVYLSTELEGNVLFVDGLDAMVESLDYDKHMSIASLEGVNFHDLSSDIEGYVAARKEEFLKAFMAQLVVRRSDFKKYLDYLDSLIETVENGLNGE